MSDAERMGFDASWSMAVGDRALILRRLAAATGRLRKHRRRPGEPDD